jgi:hypothetical protein
VRGEESAFRQFIACRDDSPAPIAWGRGNRVGYFLRWAIRYSVLFLYFSLTCPG